MSKVIVLTCSPRVKGNTDTVGATLFEELRNILVPIELISLRTLKINPCISCGFCITHPEQCSLEAKDEVGWLFDKIRTASVLITISPIFFYGPPAQFKSFIDRAQKYWYHDNYILHDNPTDSPFLKPAFAILIAARTRGQRVFDPTLLILKSFFQCIGFTLKDSLLLRGLDEPQDFLNSQASKTQLSSFTHLIESSFNSTLL